MEAIFNVLRFLVVVGLAFYVIWSGESSPGERVLAVLIFAVYVQISDVLRRMK